MGVRSRCLASLLAVLAAADAARAEEPPRAPAKEATLSPADAYRALRAAYDAERWDEVLSLTGPCFQPGADRDHMWWAAAMACMAAGHLERWDDCLHFARVCSGAQQPPAPSEVRAAWEGLLAISEAGALIALGRLEEAARVVDSSARRLPELRIDLAWRILRLAARPEVGIIFDAGVVSPADEGRMREGQSRIEKAIPAAIARLRRRLGVEDLSVPALRILVVTDGPIAAASTMRRGDGWLGFLKVRAEAIIHATQEDESVLAHEIAHVVHLCEGGGKGTPHWVAEGLSHWLEAEDDSLHRERVLWNALRGTGEPNSSSVSALLRSEEALAAADDFPQRVAGGVIFFELERTFGTATVQRISRRTLRERDHARVFREETGLEMRPMLERVRESYLKWSREAFPEAAALSDASVAAAKGRLAESRDAVDGVLATVRDPFMRSFGELLLLQILNRLQDWPRARAATRPVRIFRESRPLSFVVSEGLLLELDALAGSGDWRGVVALASDPRVPLWVRNPRSRVAVAEALAEAEKHLAESAPPK